MGSETTLRTKLALLNALTLSGIAGEQARQSGHYRRNHHSEHTG